MIKEIFSAKEPTDEDYIYLRDDSGCAQIREFVESLWMRFKPLADSGFIDLIAANFHERFWEMYLACTLLDAGMNLSSKDSGPDLRIENGEKPIWVEAIAPGCGTGPDAVPPHNTNGEAINVPEEKVILRLRSAIENKYRRYLKYLENGIVSPFDPYIIAINGYNIPFWMSPGDPPFIVKSVYPLGANTVTFNIKTKKIVGQGIERRSEIKKENESVVETTVFENTSYAGISAIIYSCANIWPREIPNQLGSDFQLLHNSQATNPIKHGWLKVGKEIWQLGNKLEVKKW